MATNELPKYYETFIPVLTVLKDGEKVHYNELRKRVRDQFYSDLPNELLELKTKDGDQLILNRIGWAKAYLKQAGHISQPERAMVQITNKGLVALANGKLSLKDVKADPDFLSHRKNRNNTLQEIAGIDEQTPQDLIDSGFQATESALKEDMLEKLRSIDPYLFEKIVNDLFEKMGYGGATTTVKSGDGGIDGIINKDELGLDKIYIQAKRYKAESKVHEPEIRNFIGAMSGDTQKGIFVTTSEFSEKAYVKAREAHHKIILIDGFELVALMLKHSVGFQTRNTYEVKEIDEDYFEQ